MNYDNDIPVAPGSWWDLERNGEISPLATCPKGHKIYIIAGKSMCDCDKPINEFDRRKHDHTGISLIDKLEF